MKNRSLALVALGLASLIGATTHAAPAIARSDILSADVLRWASGNGGMSFQTASDGGMAITVSTPLFEMGTSTQAGQGCSPYPANFAPCELTLRNTRDGQGLANPIRLDFATPVSGGGAQFGMGDRWGTFTAVVSAYDASGNLLESHTRTGDTQFTADDSAVFVGLQRESADIARLMFDVLPYGVPEASPNFFGDNFLIGRVELSTAVTAVPEPQAWLLMALGVAVLVAGRSSRHRRA